MKKNAWTRITTTDSRRSLPLPSTGLKQQNPASDEVNLAAVRFASAIPRQFTATAAVRTWLGPSNRGIPVRNQIHPFLLFCRYVKDTCIRRRADALLCSQGGRRGMGTCIAGDGSEGGAGWSAAAPRCGARPPGGRSAPTGHLDREGIRIQHQLGGPFSGQGAGR